MSMLTISDRRAIMTKSMLEPGFRELLRRDPRAAVEQATGRAAPEGARISLVEEQDDAWEFVVPAGDIDPSLPQPCDPRSVIENQVYELLRDEPLVRSRAFGDPKGFLAERLQFDIGDARVNVREEQPGELVLILPYGDSRDELSEGALDLVAGGSAPGCDEVKGMTRAPASPSMPTT
jgi:hypothetical protein